MLVILLQSSYIFLSVLYPRSLNFNHVLLSELKLVKNDFFCSNVVLQFLSLSPL